MIYITDLGVDRNYEGRGIGKQLMKTAHDIVGDEKDIAMYLIANENAVPFAERIVDIYQKLSSKPGYGSLEGMVLPTTVNLTFIYKYVRGKETVSDESIEMDWFAPNQVKEKITDSYIRKAVEDLLEYLLQDKCAIFSVG